LINSQWSLLIRLPIYREALHPNIKAKKFISKIKKYKVKINIAIMVFFQKRILILKFKWKRIFKTIYFIIKTCKIKTAKIKIFKTHRIHINKLLVIWNKNWGVRIDSNLSPPHKILKRLDYLLKIVNFQIKKINKAKLRKGNNKNWKMKTIKKIKNLVLKISRN
jgi:hypothetical protein